MRSSCCCSMVYKRDFICLPQLQLPPLLPHGIQVTSIRRGHSCVESDLLLTECGSGVLRPAHAVLRNRANEAERRDLALPSCTAADCGFSSAEDLCRSCFREMIIKCQLSGTLRSTRNRTREPGRCLSTNSCWAI